MGGLPSDLAESFFTDIIGGLAEPQISDPDTVSDLNEVIDDMIAVVIALEDVQKNYHALLLQELGDGALDDAA
ncbi:MAG: hypothetical protein ACSHXB_20345 [Sulfitobacter sp.]